jgi:hypothetical protein
MIKMCACDTSEINVSEIVRKILHAIFCNCTIFGLWHWNDVKCISLKRKN